MAANAVTFPLTSAQLTATPADAANLLYTCPVGTRARITMLSFLNTGAAGTISVYIVRSGGAIGVTNQLWNAAPIPATGIQPKGVICYEAVNQVLNPGDFIRAVADAINKMTPMGSVVEFT